MNKTTKIVSSTAAALAAATGIYFATTTSDSDSQTITSDSDSTEVTTEYTINWNEYINISQYLPNIPVVDVPEVEVFNIDLPNIGIETITENTSIGHMEINVPDTSTIVDDVEFVTIENIGETSITLSDYEIQEILLSIPEIQNYDDLIAKGVEIAANLKKLFKDQRSIDHDVNILNNEFINEWINIYNTYTNSNFKQILKFKPFRMISEVRVPKSDEEFKILKHNLLYYKSQGYDSVLITFDGSEKQLDLKYLAIYVKQFGFRIFFTFGGKEKLKESIFINPETLKYSLSVLAQESEGFIIGWRRTSVHLLEQDEQFMNYMIDAIRKSNSNCLVIGEFYYGNTATYPHKNQWGFGQNIPKCSSAILINNFGFSSVDINSVITKLVPSKIGKHNYVGLVVGQKPYYATRYKNGLTFEQNRVIKVQIENNFKKAGCVGTITLHDDGKDFSENHNNNLSSSKFN